MSTTVTRRSHKRTRGAAALPKDVPERTDAAGPPAAADALSKVDAAPGDNRNGDEPPENKTNRNGATRRKAPGGHGCRGRCRLGRALLPV
jgi:hypothetical protein